MKTRTFYLAMAVGVTLLMHPERIGAHHAFAAEFDAEKPVILKGNITKMDWFNPHAWLYIDATEVDGKPVEGGKAQSWALEFSGAARLYRLGWRRDNLPVGGVVTVDGYRAKNGTHTAAANEVTLADGKRLFATQRE